MWRCVIDNFKTICSKRLQIKILNQTYIIITVLPTQTFLTSLIPYNFYLFLKLNLQFIFFLFCSDLMLILKNNFN